MTTGRRWYLLAYDRDREDWRTLRLDRMVATRAAGSTFTPRPAPDAREFLRHAISAAPYRYVARIRYQVPPVRRRAPLLAAIDDRRTRRMVLHFALLVVEFEVLEPAEVQAAARAVGKRLRRAGGAP